MKVAIPLEICGAVIVLFTMRDVFRDIFHPTQSGTLSDFIGRLASKLFRHTFLRPAIGPGSLVAVIFVWVILTAVGFACIYYPLFPEQLEPRSVTGGIQDRALHSLYMSIGSLGTFQIFDVQVKSSWVRLIVGLEGLVGIALITASVSWLVLVYPALERIRFLAKKTSIIERARNTSGTTQIRNENLLTELTDRVIQARIDLVLFPILLNFYPVDRSQQLALALPKLQAIAEDCMQDPCTPELRLAAHLLHHALRDFSQMLCERVLHSDENHLSATFRKFAELGE